MRILVLAINYWPEQTGIGAPAKVLKVTDPTFAYDGTRCHVHFEPVADAKSYDI